MAGHYAPHGGNIWASARLRGSSRAKPVPVGPASAAGSAPSSPALPPSTGASAIPGARAVKRWLNTTGAPGAVRLLRSLSPRVVPDDHVIAPQRTATLPDHRQWNAWAAALRVTFWMFFATAALLRWFRRIRERFARNWGAVQRRRVLLNRLDSARDYSEWVSTAAQLDVIEGRARWKNDTHPTKDADFPDCHDKDPCPKNSSKASDRRTFTATSAVTAVCDLDIVRAKLVELAKLHEERNVRGLAFALRAGLLRNYAGICHPELSTHSRVGTKRIVEDYVNVVSYLLAYIAQSESVGVHGKHSSVGGGTPSSVPNTPPLLSLRSQPELTIPRILPRSETAAAERVCGSAMGEEVKLLSVENKLLMFNEARIAYGRTALMLSGGASMGIHHLGVVKALLDQNLMPKVVCGTSAGALVASIVGIFEDAELLEIIESDDLFNPITQKPFSFRYFDEHTSIFRRIRRFLRTGVIQDVRMLQDCLRRNYGDITFQEAYMRTRRILNITVCPVRASSDPPMLLNYLTAPHVLVWSAASASCALPFVFAPVELVAKGYDGRLVPYHPHGVRWIDGSITSDIPLARIGELFNVNHFIVSQTNPHLIPRRMPLLKTRLVMLLKSEFQFRYWQALQLNLVPRVIATIFPHFLQPYEGDITIMPEVSLTDLRRLLHNPTVRSVKQCIERGERQTYPFLDRIRRQCIIEKALDASVEHVARTSPKRSDLQLQASAPTSTSPGALATKRGNSFFGRVPSWLWLDAGSLLTSGPVSAVANRISGIAGGASTVAPHKDEEHKRSHAVADLDPVSRAPGEDIFVETEVLKTPPPEERGHTWGARIYSARQSGLSSPSVSKLNMDQLQQRSLSELEQKWLDFGVTALAERAAVDPGNTSMSEEPVSEGSSTEEDRVLC